MTVLTPVLQGWGDYITNVIEYEYDYFETYEYEYDYSKK